MTPRKNLLPSLAVAAALATGGGSSGATARVAEPPPGAGPEAARIPDDAVRAETPEALAQLLAEREGPRRIGLAQRVYRGDFVVRRPVEIIGTPGTVLEGTGEGSVVTIEANDVVVRNLAVRHSGRRQTTEDAGIRATGTGVRIEHVSVEDTLFGVSFQQCSHCTIDSIRVQGLADDPMLRGDGIKLWESSDGVVRNSLIEDSRDMVIWYSKRVLLDGNVVIHSRYGAHFMYAHDSVVRNCRVVDNVVGIFVMYSQRVHAEDNVLAGAKGAAGMGIGFKDSDDATLHHNFIVGNTVGTYFDSTPRSLLGRVTFDGNVVALNQVGIRLHGSDKGIAFVKNDFHQNADVVEVEGGGDARAVQFSGNYFTGYQGYDLNGDGVGDVPYEEKLLSSVLTDARPVFRLFRGTLAMGLVDAVSRAVPVLAAKTMLVDPAPRMRPFQVGLP